MGQDYYVILRGRVKDPDAAVALTREFIKTDNFSEDCWNRSDLTNAEGCIRALLAGDAQPDKFDVCPDFTRQDPSEWRKWENEFHCCYGWESTLHSWFTAIAPSFADGSRITVYNETMKPWRLIVINGMAKEHEIPSDDPDYIVSLAITCNTCDTCDTSGIDYNYTTNYTIDIRDIGDTNDIEITETAEASESAESAEASIHQG